MSRNISRCLEMFARDLEITPRDSWLYGIGLAIKNVRYDAPAMLNWFWKIVS
jgi:hypothetical protein